MSISFWVPGIPATAGSKKPFLYRSKKDGKMHASMAPDNKRQKPWMSSVSMFAHEAYFGPLLSGPITLWITFRLPRPKSDFGSGRNSDKLKPSAASYHIKKPDLDKLNRAVSDALKGIIWKDDSQVCALHSTKEYGSNPGAQITIQEA
jgi:Holliday junction resolvase RusA-like endonuclease